MILKGGAALAVAGSAGTSRSKPFDAWGPSGDNAGNAGCYKPTKPDYPDEVCVWQSKGDFDLPPEGGYAELVGGKVCEVSIQAGYSPPGYALRTTKLRKQKWHEPRCLNR